MNLDKIWTFPKYLPFVQPELTDAMLQDAENKLGYKLPSEFVQISRIQNGGYIAYSLANSPHTMIYGIGPKFPSLTDFDWAEDQEYVSFQLDGLIPFDGDGHWHLCLDYRNSPNVPQVTFIDIESNQSSVIAENFNAYLKLLERQFHQKFMMNYSETIHENLTIIKDLLNIQFESANSWAHGYPIYRAKFNNDAYIWVSPNKVPIGFIRENEKGYKQLKSQMEIMVSQYPEIPQHCLLIQTSDEKLTQLLFHKLKDKSIRVNFLEHIIPLKLITQNEQNNS